MMPARPSLSAALILTFAVAACGQEQPPKQVSIDDPAMAEALEGQLLVDPDLSQQNLRNLAVVPPGPVDPALPQGIGGKPNAPAASQPQL